MMKNKKKDNLISILQQFIHYADCSFYRWLFEDFYCKLTSVYFFDILLINGTVYEEELNLKKPLINVKVKLKKHWISPSYILSNHAWSFKNPMLKKLEIVTF